MSRRTAVITGITGQTGSYATEQLIDAGFNVVGLTRRTSTNNTERIEHLLDSPSLELVTLDLQDASGLNHLFSTIKPDRVLHFGAQSHVHVSFTNPTSTFLINTIGTTNVLEAIRLFSPSTRMVNASSSEMFGDEGLDVGQNEFTKFNPCSPYAVSKLANHHMVKIYRDAYNLYACSLIMFNNESPRRGENFVTRKITKYIGKLLHYKNTLEGSFDDSFPRLTLGNLEACRDWSFSGDMARAANLLLDQSTPEDHIACSGETHSIKEFLTEAFGYVGLDWEKYVVIDKSFFRPKEVPFLRGESTIKRLGWEPSVTFKELVHIMVDGDICAAQEKRNSIIL